MEIRDRRKAAGLTVEELADAAGVNARHLYRIEAGEIRSPGLALLERLAGALDCPVTDLAPGNLKTAAANSQRVNSREALTLLDQGSQVSAQLFDFRVGPVTFRVNRFDGGELVLSGNIHGMLMEGLVDFEQRGKNPDDRAS